jgi:hypothetical protein
MELLLVIMLALRSLPDDVSTFTMENPTNHVVTFTRTGTNTWSSTGPTPEEDNAIYRVTGTSLFVGQQPDEMEITPNSGWGLTPATRCRELTSLKHTDGTMLSLDHSATGIVFRISRPARKEMIVRIRWKK